MLASRLLRRRSDGQGGQSWEEMPQKGCLEEAVWKMSLAGSPR